MFLELAERKPFTVQDANDVQKVGVLSWIAANLMETRDVPFSVAQLPAVQQMVVMNAVDLGFALEYCVPIRRLGRVVLFALLPQVVRQSEPVRREQPRRAFDPVIPFWVSGLLGKTRERHNQAVAQFLRTGKGEWITGALPDICQSLWVEGPSLEEAFYYLTAMQGLASGMWRHVPEFWRVAELEQTMVNRGRVTSREAYRFLLDG